MGQFVEVKSHDGQSFSAYKAAPANGSGPGLVLLQEIFGVNDYMTSMADRYAEEGHATRLGIGSPYDPHMKLVFPSVGAFK